jgi:hypothetical protein
MYIVAIHSIANPEKFWDAAQTTPFPEGVTLHSTFPNADGTQAVCLWEAGSLDEVRSLVDSAVGDSSDNEFYEVGANAQGLPG